jgi:uncharacterized protein (DUF2062 family)
MQFNRLPKKEDILKKPILRKLSPYLSSPDLWQMNRSSWRRAFLIGLFCAMQPWPIQIILATLLSISFRAHLPLTLSLVWVNNPFSFIPLFLLSNEIGSYLLHKPRLDIANFSTFSAIDYSTHLQTLTLGGLILGLIVGASAYVLSDIIWLFQHRIKHK